MATDFTLLVGTKVDDSQILQQLNTISKKTSVTVKVKADTGSLETLKTVTTKSTDALGNLVTTTEKFNKSGESLGTVVTDVTQKMETYNKTSNTASQANEQISSSADKASKSTKSLGADFVDTTLKVAKFGASTAVIGVFYSAIQEAKEAVTDFDAAMIEFNKVSDLSGDSLNDYTQKLADMGEEVGRSRTEMLESATMFKKTGSSEEESAELAKVAEMYRNIADAQVSSADAASFLVSQMKAYNITAEDSIEIIDKVNEVANRFSVGTNDLQLALQTSSSTLGTLGNDLSETISLLTAGTEIIVNQPQRVGRGLRSVGLELNKMAQETDTLTDSTGQVSVAFKDEEGQLKSTYQILADLYPQWQKLNDEQKANLANQIAGKPLRQACIGLINGEDGMITHNCIKLLYGCLRALYTKLY